MKQRGGTAAAAAAAAPAAARARPRRRRGEVRRKERLRRAVVPSAAGLPGGGSDGAAGGARGALCRTGSSRCSPGSRSPSTARDGRRLRRGREAHDERVSRLPQEARIDPNVFRDDFLYTVEVEGVFKAQLRSLYALYECYAGEGPNGTAALLSLPEWLEMLVHLDLFDRDFTPREATLAFQWARMRVVDEIKGRSRMMNICFIDFLEALLRVALEKKLPTPDMLRKLNPSRRTAGEYFLELRRMPEDEYDDFLDRHTQSTIMSADKVGMRPHMALEALLSIVTAQVRGFASQAASSPNLTAGEVRAFVEGAKQRIKDAPKPQLGAQVLLMVDHGSPDA